MRKNVSLILPVLTAGSAFLYLALGLASLDDHLFLEFDSPIYIVLARSLALGEGFSDLSIPGSPPECSRFPLYPLLLVPGAVIFPLSVPAAKFASFLISAAALAVFFSCLRRSNGGWWALAGAALLAFNPFILFRYAVQPLGEYLYLLIVLAFFCWYFSPRREVGSSLRHGIAITLFFAAAALWKENGLALPFAYLFYRWRYRRLGRADWSAVAISVLLSWSRPDTPSSPPC